MESEENSSRIVLSRIRKQLEDTIIAQQEASEKLKKSIPSDAVSIVKYKGAVDELEAERAAHAKTRAELKEAQDQLELANGEIEVLQKQLAREKALFEKTFSLIKKNQLRDADVDGNFCNSRSDETAVSAVNEDCNSKVTATCDQMNRISNTRQKRNLNNLETDSDLSVSSEDDMVEQQIWNENSSLAQQPLSQMQYLQNSEAVKARSMKSNPRLCIKNPVSSSTSMALRRHDEHITRTNKTKPSTKV